MANKRIVEDGMRTRFTSERQPPRSGRKPKLYTIAKKAYNVSREEWNEVKLYLLQCTPSEIDEIIDKKDTPMWVLILARGLKRNAAKGVTDVLNDMEDRLFGRAPVAPEEKDDQPVNGSVDIEKWIEENTDE
ncbi:MAG: hypothetical protein ACLR8S_11550 [Paraprevotella clara]|uniref:Uncharacterized protein n=2 Tax=Paraprevotella clara TaxID=454154 RepID=A0A6N3EUR4_9BACT